MDDKKESSVAGGIKGVQAPSAPMIKRKQHVESFEDLVAHSELNNESISETVKKRGEQWVVYDDKTKVEKGVYTDREAAWKKQRQMRQSQKGKNKSVKHGSTFKKTKRKKNQSKLAPKVNTAPKAHLAPKAQKEHLMTMFKESVKRVLLSEGSALSYVFEQSPMQNDSNVWETFLEKISKQTLLSDPKLMNLLQGMAKNEVKALGNAVVAIKKSLEKNGFEVEQKKPDQNKEGDLFLNFQIKMPESNKKLDFAVQLEHGKPLIQIPEQTKAFLNNMATSESKLLRSELIHIQETILNNMNEVIEMIEKRNGYLGKLQTDTQKALKSMSPLQIIMLRYLLKSKYKGVK